MAYSVWLFSSIHMPKAISHMPMLSRLHPAVLPVDCTLDFCHLVALLYHLRRIQRLVLTNIHSRRRVAIDEAREKSKVPHVFVAFAIAI